MKIAILTFGSRGDVEPFLALAQGLRRAGHNVTLAAPAGYADFIAGHGVEAYPVPVDLLALWRRPDMVGPQRQRNLLARWRTGHRRLSKENAIALQSAESACEGADFILHTGDAYGGFEIAERDRIPAAFAYPFPLAPTQEFRSFLSMPGFTLGGAFNLWTHRLYLGLQWRVFGAGLNSWRQVNFGLPPLRSYLDMLDQRRKVGAPTLYAYSPAVIPKPADWQATDHVTGYWFLEPPPSFKPSPEIERFLAEGPPPVYVGFGSMSVDDPLRQTSVVVEALERAGQRGILMTGEGAALSPVAASPNILFVRSAPHHWLFPRVAAAVHHGGAGTTAAVLRAGIPGVVTPLMFDQFSWARRVKALGVGVRGPYLTLMTPEKLAAAITKAVGDPAIRSRAAALGEKIRAENGVDNAVAVIERHAMEFKAKKGAAHAFSPA